MKKMTVAYIGNGKSANRYHLPFSLKLNNIKVKTIYARHIEHDIWKEVPGIKYTTDINDIYQDQEIDLVVLSVPAAAHY